MKQCTQCGSVKSLAEFYQRGDRPAGYRPNCKSCCRAACRANRSAHVDARRASCKRWREEHPEQVRARNKTRSKAWYEANKKRRFALTTAWVAAHPNAVKVIRRTWQKANLEKVAAKTAVRRAATLRASPTWAEHEAIGKVYAKAKEFGMEVDHVVPLQSDRVCGLHVWANLQLLSAPDNRAKSNRFWPDM